MSDARKPVLSTYAVATLVFRAEFRKLSDTRASRWILLSLVALALLVGALAAAPLPAGEVLTAGFLIQAMQLPLALAMSLLGILTMAGDWGHRTTTTYFPLVRRRSTIFLAKVGASVAMSALLLVALLGASLVLLQMNHVLGQRAVSADGLGTGIRSATGATMLGSLFGLAVASIVRRVALSLVLVPVLAIGINAVSLALVPSAVQPLFSTLTPLVLFANTADAHVTVPLWQVLTSIALWYLEPLVLGWQIAERAEA